MLEAIIQRVGEFAENEEQEDMRAKVSLQLGTRATPPLSVLVHTYRTRD